MAAPTEELELRLRLPLPAGVAQVALGALGPDLLPRPGGGGGGPRLSPPAQLRCCGEELHARWVAPGARGLRGGVSTFLELLGLVLETIECFGGEGPGLGPAPTQAPPPRPENPSKPPV